MQHPRVAKVIWELPGVSFAAVNMCKLYLLPDAGGMLANNKQLQTGLRLASNLNLSGRLSHTQRFRLYRQSLDSTFRSVVPDLASLLRRSTETKAHDVFFWLAFHSNETFARQRERDGPRKRLVAVANLARPSCLLTPPRARPPRLCGSVAVLRPAGARRAAWLGYLQQGDAKDHPRWLRGLWHHPRRPDGGVGLWRDGVVTIGGALSAGGSKLSTCIANPKPNPNPNPLYEPPVQVLELQICKGMRSNALELGYGVSAKRFLTQRAVAAYIDLGWRGGFEEPVGGGGDDEVAAANSEGAHQLLLPVNFSWISLALQVRG
eukprot:1549859-Prymnesium_polylepis.1